MTGNFLRLIKSAVKGLRIIVRCGDSTVWEDMNCPPITSSTGQSQDAPIHLIISLSAVPDAITIQSIKTECQ